MGSDDVQPALVSTLAQHGTQPDSAHWTVATMTCTGPSDDAAAPSIDADQVGSGSRGASAACVAPRSQYMGAVALSLSLDSGATVCANALLQLDPSD